MNGMSWKISVRKARDGALDGRIAEVEQSLRGPEIVVGAVDVHPVLLDEQARKRLPFDQSDRRADVVRIDAAAIDHAPRVVAILPVERHVAVEGEVPQIVQVAAVAAGGYEEQQAPAPCLGQRVSGRLADPVSLEADQRSVDIQKKSFDHSVVFRNSYSAGIARQR